MAIYSKARTAISATLPQIHAEERTWPWSQPLWLRKSEANSSSRNLLQILLHVTSALFSVRTLYLLMMLVTGWMTWKLSCCSIVRHSTLVCQQLARSYFSLYFQKIPLATPVECPQWEHPLLKLYFLEAFSSLGVCVTCQEHPGCSCLSFFNIGHHALSTALVGSVHWHCCVFHDCVYLVWWMVKFCHC